MTLAQVRERFRANQRGFAARFAWLLAIFGVALLCDAVSTTWFMLQEGPAQEVHPVVRSVSHMLGPIAGPWLGAVWKFCAAVLVAIYLRRWAWLILTVGTILSLWAAWFNVWGKEIYVPNLLHWIPW